MKIDHLTRIALDIFDYSAQNAIAKMYDAYAILGLKYSRTEGYCSKEELHDFLTEYNFKTRNREVYVCIEDNWGAIVVIEFDDVGNYRLHEYDLGVALFDSEDIPGVDERSQLDTAEKLLTVKENLESYGWGSCSIWYKQNTYLNLIGKADWVTNFDDRYNIVTNKRIASSDLKSVILGSHNASVHTNVSAISMFYDKSGFDIKSAIASIETLMKEMAVKDDTKFSIGGQGYTYHAVYGKIYTTEEYGAAVEEFNKSVRMVREFVDEEVKPTTPPPSTSYLKRIGNFIKGY